MGRQLNNILRLVLIASAFLTHAAIAQSLKAPDSGRLLATGGVSTVEGGGGGGLTPWALITGYGTRDSYGANMHASYLGTQDYSLRSVGAAVGIANRFEFSLAHQEFRATGGALNGLGLGQDVIGIKIKIVGDALYDQDQWMPQIAVGAQYKRHDGITGPLSAEGVTSVEQLGAANESGIDYYISASKIMLEHSLLLSGTIRLTKANQFGLLGFGGPRGDSYQPVLEGSAAYLFNRYLVIGGEYRQKRGNLDPFAIDNEDDAYDVFIAYFPTKNVSLTAAYVVLGQITRFNPSSQKGLYLSIQAGF